MNDDVEGSTPAVSRKRPYPAEDGVLALLSDRAPAERLLPGLNLHAGMFKHHTTKAVAALSAQLREAAALGDAKDQILLILEELQDYVIDSQVLHKTQIGKEVAKVKKNAERRAEHDVAQKAEQLHSQWKKDFDIRKRAIEGFKEKGALNQASASKLEDGLFNFSCPLGFLEGDAYREYQRHFIRLRGHLKARGPGSLVQRLAAGEMCYTEVVSRSDADLMSTEKMRKIEADRQHALKAALAPGSAEPQGIVTDEYLCPTCQGTRTSYIEVHSGYHTDGQDATVVVTCLDCKARWKASDDHGGGA